MTEKMILDSVFRFSREYVKHRFYSDDEERDDHGRWSGGGDSEAGEKGTVNGKPIGKIIDDYRNSNEGKAEIKAMNDKEDKISSLAKQMKEIRQKKNAIYSFLKKGISGEAYQKLRDQADDLTDKHLDLQTQYSKLIRS